MTIETPKSAPDIAAQLIANGYQPIPIQNGKKGPNTPNWQNRTFTLTDFDADANIGVKHDRLGCVDVDVYDADLSAEIRDEFLRRFPRCLERVGQAPKTALVFRLPDDPYTVSNTTKRKKKGVEAQVEIRTKTGQMVAYGKHPDTKQPYRWTRGELWETPLESLPMPADWEIQEFRDWAEAKIRDWAEEGAQHPSQHATTAIQPPSDTRIKIDTGGGYHAAAETTPEEALEIVSWINADDYDTWIKVLGGLHEKGDHMLRVAEAWSATSEKYRAGEVERRWRTFGPSSGNVWNGVCKLAEAHGANLSDIALKHKGGVEAAPVGTTRMPTIPHAKIVEDVVNAQIDSFKAGIFRACDLDGQPVPERVWHVHDLIPANTVTLLSGDGGTGKSLCALQLAVSTALQRPWLGLAVRHGKAVYLSAEDDKAELHRRLADITRAENATLADLGELTLRSLAGEDALLATVAKGGTLQATPLLEAVKQLLQHNCPDLLVFDTLADYFPGNENDRAQARQFIGMLRGLAINHQCAVVMLAHPSVAGMASGTGTSGSTGWNNSVRSRLYLSRVVQDGYEQNPDARVLRTMKSNYSGIGGEIALTWQNGVFVADAPVTGLDRMAASAKAERVFLALLRMFAEQGRTVNHAGSASYAPKVFAEHPKSEGMTKRALKAAMDTLLIAGKIRIVESGPPSKRRSHLEMAE